MANYATRTEKATPKAQASTVRPGVMDNRADNRAASVTQRHLISVAANSAQTKQLQAAVAMMASGKGKESPLQRLTQLHAGADGGIVQRKTEITYETQPVQYEDALGNTKTEQVGKVANAFIDVKDPVVGSGPDNQQKAMYDRLKDVYGQTFIRGHLLNDHLGGIGEVYNLFPITYHANSEHKITAEGNLKKHVRGEFKAIQNTPGEIAFVRYRVEAIAAQPSNLASSADAVFKCTMVSAHDGLPLGKSQEWTIYSQPGNKVTATGDRSTKQDYSNDNLGQFGATEKGESYATLGSRIRSTVNGWKGDQHGSFLIGGSLDGFVSLGQAKDECLKQIDEYIEKDSCFEGQVEDILEHAKAKLMDVHDTQTLQTEFDSLKTEILKFELAHKKQQFINHVGTNLVKTTIPEQAKQFLFDSVQKQIGGITDLSSLKQAVDAFPAWIEQQIEQIVQMQNSQNQQNGQSNQGTQGNQDNK